MAADVDDYFQKVARSTATTLSSPGYTVGNTTVNVGSTANWEDETGVTFAIDEIDSSGERITGTYNVFRGVVSSATQLSDVTYVGGDANRNYSAGATTRVYVLVSAYQMNRLIDGIIVEHNQDGTHGDITADSIVVAGNVEAESFSITGSGGNQGWDTGLPAPDSVTLSGNRSYDLVFNSTDLTDTITPGMRVRTTRTVTAPIQCADLESSSSQYFNKTSPAGTTFTDDFCAGAWVKLESYGAAQVIVSRYNGTSGWELQITADGAVLFAGYNAGSSNFSRITSYRSIPLGKWTHIAAQLDMSAFTNTTTTSYVMINGSNAPGVVARGGTNPTALVQAGNLEVGGRNSGTLPFDGKLAEVWYSSAKITQDNVRTLISQSITASQITTHSIVSHFSLNNTLNDTNTTSANNLTAQASAAATNADSPFSLGPELASAYTTGTTDFGIVTNTAFSTNTTLTVQVPEGCTIPTSGGVSAILYSALDSPYGLPKDATRWRVLAFARTVLSASGSTTATWYASNLDLAVPSGRWDLGYSTNVDASATSGSMQVGATLSTTSAAETDARMSSNHRVDSATRLRSQFTQLGMDTSLSSSTLHYLNIMTTGTSPSALSAAGNVGRLEIWADLAYL